MSFANLKRKRSNVLDTLVTEAAKLNKSNDYTDDRFWKPSRDAAGNGYAEIRFLPQVENENVPWVRYWEHWFKGPTGQFYIEKSLTSINETDPVGEFNSTLFNADSDPDSPKKKQARAQKRKLNYVSNILVISDSSHPENNGKVFLYSYGKKIYDKVMDAMQPEFQDEDPINPFDMWAGANFKIKIRDVEGWVNYDRSEFVSPSQMFEDEEAMETIYSQVHPLFEFIDPEKYKSYDELKARLNVVLGNTQSEVSKAAMNSSPSPTMQEKSPVDDSLGGFDGNSDDDNSIDDGDIDDVMSQFSNLLDD
jgi:hypothetical protein